MTDWEAANTISYLQNPNNVDDDAYDRSYDADIDIHRNDENNDNLRYHDTDSKRTKDDQGGVKIKSRKKGKRLETAEAALARLTHAYKTALNCMGALHQLSAAIEKLHLENTLGNKEKRGQLSMTPTDLKKEKLNKDDAVFASTGIQGDTEHTLQSDTKTEDESNYESVMNGLFEQVINAAQSARYAFEETILLDPLVSSYAPSFCYAHNSMISKPQQLCTLEKTGVHKMNNENVLLDEKKLNETKEDEEKDDNDDDEELMLIQRSSFMKRKNMGSTTLNTASYIKSFSNSHNLVISSSSHRSSIQELAYLSLINYADLLTCCTYVKNDITNPILSKNERASILEQGITKTLPGLSIVFQSEYLNCMNCKNQLMSKNKHDSTLNTDESFSCWNWKSNINEALKDTRKLALTAYFDASQLNLRFDPSLWNKLACAARAFEKATISTDEKIFQKEEHNMKQQQYMSDKNVNEKASETSNNSLPGNDSSILSPHIRWLEKYALERGLTTTLPNGIPPNRILMKSLTELSNEKLSLSKKKYDSVRNHCFTKNKIMKKKRKRQELELNLTRYSWSTLGRLLMKVCKEESRQIFPKSNGLSDGNCMSEYSSFYQSVRKRRKEAMSTYCSPKILLQISPMLTLPPAALGTVCDFLGSWCRNQHEDSEEIWKSSKDVKKFESTCRALSVAIISARASLEEEKNYVRLQEQHMMIKANLEHERKLEDARVMASKSLLENRDSQLTGDKKTIKSNISTGSNSREQQTGQDDCERKDISTHIQSQRLRSNRISKRVQSQLITSGIAAAKNEKRNSLEYCLLQSILGLKSGDSQYLQQLDTTITLSDLPPFAQFLDHLSREFPLLFSDGGKSRVEGALLFSIKERRDTMSTVEAARDGPSSLITFIEERSGSNSGPLDLLSHFIVHAALHVEEIFLSETNGTMLLSSCLMDCFEIYMKRTGNMEDFFIASNWINNENSSNIGKITKSDIDGFAVNLLIAELRMRRSERFGLEVDSFENDVSYISFIVPNLVKMSDTLEKSDIPNSYATIVPKLRSRTYWLASVYYLWFSRKSQLHVDASKAESLALTYLDATIKTIKNIESGNSMNPKTTDKSIFTPHLESPGRDGEHWKRLNESTLSTYKDSLQAILIVAHAKKRFCKIQRRIEKEKKNENDSNSSGEENTIIESKKTEIHKIIPSERIATELKEISDDILHRYSVKGCVSHHHELISDFYSSCNFAHVRERTTVKRDNSSHDTVGTNGHDKWGDLWFILPNFSCCSIPSWEVNQDLSLLSILGSCLSLKVENGILFLKLLSRLILTAFEEHKKCVTHGKKNCSNNSMDDEYAEDYFSDNDTNESIGQKHNNKRIMCEETTYLLCVEYFMDKFSEIISNLRSQNNSSINREIELIVGSTELLSLIQVSVVESAPHLKSLTDFHSEAEFEKESNTPNLSLLLTCNRFVSSIVKMKSEDNSILETVYYLSLTHLLIQYKNVFPSLIRKKSDKRQSRGDRQKACIAEADCVGAVASILANFMSLNLPIVSNEGTLEASPLIMSMFHKESICSEEPTTKHNIVVGSTLLTQLIDSLLWFWKYIVNTDILSRGQDSSHFCVFDKGSNTPMNSIDRSVAKRIFSPIVAAIVSLCGSCMRASRVKYTDNISEYSLPQNLSDNDNDSDDSVSCIFSHDNDTEPNDSIEANSKAKRSQQIILNSLFQSIHCITLIFGCIDEKQSCILSPSFLLETQKPLIPLVVIRVLSHISDMIISEFNENKKKGAIWSSQYPYGSRTIGMQLDCLLHKAYKCLYGFTLSYNQQQTIDNMNYIMTAPPTTLDPSKYKFFKPESLVAAAQLYRCVKRTYLDSRKFPPRVALETIASSLPIAEESRESKEIRRFLFANPGTLLKTYQIKDSKCNDESHDNLPEGFPEWVLENDHADNSMDIEDTSNIREGHKNMNELDILRKGLAHDLAQGPLPKPGSFDNVLEISSITDEPIPKTNSTHNDRHETSLYEIALSKKFNSLLNDLCFSPFNPEGWAHVALCLSSKADFICDRISSLSLSYDKEDFFIEPKQEKIGGKNIKDPGVVKTFPIDQLTMLQEEECRHVGKNWIPCLGNDLSAYVSFSWASFSSLLECATCISEEMDSAVGSTSINERDASTYVKNKMKRLYVAGKYAIWQHSWGSMFIQALRIMAKRCLQISFVLAKRKAFNAKDESIEVIDNLKHLVVEVAETTATACYNELQGGMLYGCPMQRMPNATKRQLAHQAVHHFNEIIDWHQIKEEDGKVCIPPKTNQTDEVECDFWPYFFMLGKCYEKIAGTFLQQNYSEKDVSITPGDNTSEPRLYERHMIKSLANYSIALKKAIQMENEGRLVDQQGGGSSSGSTEAFYRLHASRLKILLRAVRRHTEERKSAEIEAIRLVSAYDYSETSTLSEDLKGDSNIISNEFVRDKIWETFSDIVAAMAQCRVKDAFFHRSVYRHAQCLLLAPIVNDPYNEATYDLGSLGSIPITRAYHLRGLSTDSCAKSAASTIASLFDKKRAHLCAVWVTTPSKPSPFEVLNDSIRKYDRLRIKYIGAYIDCMHLCRRIDTLETFIGWTSSCRRDLCSSYEESAKLRGKSPKIHHMKDNMLDGFGLIFFAKQKANRAIADIIIKEVTDLNNKSDKELTQKAIDDKNSLICIKNTLFSFLKIAYASFVRTRCRLEDDRWRKEYLTKGCLLEADALVLAYQSYNDIIKQIEGSSTTEAKSTTALDLSFQNKKKDLKREKVFILRTAISTCTKLIPLKTRRKTSTNDTKK